MRKHEKTISLAESSHLSVSRLISKALKDGFISDVEFDSILREIEKYFSMKERLRNKQRKDSTVKSQPTKPDFFLFFWIFYADFFSVRKYFDFGWDCDFFMLN